MVERVFVKIVFINNHYENMVDILCFPVISVVLSSLNMTPYSHVVYQRGSQSPRDLADTYDNRIQYKLFEFVQQHKAGDEIMLTPPPLSNESSPVQKKRKYNECTAYTSAKYEKLQKELSSCIFRNFRQLAHIGNNENRYCYVDTEHNISRVTTSKIELPLDPTYNTLYGFLKIYSHTSQRLYMQSLNYRNMINLYNHIIVYFDVTKYHQKYSENIFFLPPSIQIQNICKSIQDRSSSLSPPLPSTCVVNGDKDGRDNTARDDSNDNTSSAAQMNLKILEALLADEIFIDS